MRSETGSTLLETALVAALIAIVAMVSLSVAGQTASDTFTITGVQIEAAACTGSPC